MSPNRSTDYYNNGYILVLQVENELFRIDISRLATHSEFFKNMLDFPAGPKSHEGSDDANPLIIPHLTAEEFHDLLYVFYSSPIDPKYVEFMSGASNRSNQNILSFKRYLNVSRLAHRFCMSELEVWGKVQLKILQTSYLAIDWLNLTDHLGLLSYATISSGETNDEFTRTTFEYFCYFVSEAKEEAVVDFYRGAMKELLDPVIRAVVLVRMVLIGQRFWAAKLSWAERAPLYALQAHILPLPSQPAFLTLNQAQSIEKALKNESGRSDYICGQMVNSFGPVWRRHIGGRWSQRSEEFNTIREINKLPTMQKILREQIPSFCSCQGHDCFQVLLTNISILMRQFYMAVHNTFERVTTDGPVQVE